MQIEVGDKVRIIKYGSLAWIRDPKLYYKIWPILRKDGDIMVCDTDPQLVGQIGIVDKITETQGHIQYALSGIKGKCAWYDVKQIELVAKKNVTYENIKGL